MGAGPGAGRPRSAWWWVVLGLAILGLPLATLAFSLRVFFWTEEIQDEPALAVVATLTAVLLGIGVGSRSLVFLVSSLDSPPVEVARDHRRELRLGAAGALLGCTVFLGVVGGLVWALGLLLPERVTVVAAVVLSLVGVPLAAPVTFGLVSLRRRARSREATSTPGR